MGVWQELDTVRLSAMTALFSYTRAMNIFTITHLGPAGVHIQVREDFGCMLRVSALL